MNNLIGPPTNPDNNETLNASNLSITSTKQSENNSSANTAYSQSVESNTNNNRNLSNSSALLNNLPPPINLNPVDLASKKQNFQLNKNYSLPATCASNSASRPSTSNEIRNRPNNYLLQVTSAPSSVFTTRNNTLTHSGSWNTPLELVNKNELVEDDNTSNINSPKFTFKRQCAIDFPANQLSQSVSATSSTASASATTLAGENSLEIRTSSSATNLPSNNARYYFSNQLTIEQIRNGKNKSDSDVNQLRQSNVPLYSSTSSSSKLANEFKTVTQKDRQTSKENSYMSTNREDDQQLLKNQINSSPFIGFTNHRTHRQHSNHPSTNSKLHKKRDKDRKRNSSASTNGNQKTNVNPSSRINFTNFFTRTGNQILASLTGMKRIKHMPAIILTPNNSLEEKTNLAEKRRSTAQLISSGSNSEVTSTCSLPMDQPNPPPNNITRPQTASCEAVINLGASATNSGSGNVVTTCSSSTNTISQPNQYSSLDDYRLRLIANYEAIPPVPPPSAASWFNAQTIGRPYLTYRQRTDDGELRKRKQEQWLSTKQASIASQASTGFLSSLLPSGISNTYGRTLHKSFDYAYNPMSTMISNQQLGSGSYARTVYHSTGSVPTTNLPSASNNLITIDSQHLKKAVSNGQEIKSRTSLTSEQMKLEKNRARYQNFSKNVLRADTNTTTHSDSLKGAESCSEMSRKHRNSLYEIKETARRKFSLIPKVSCFFSSV